MNVNPNGEDSNSSIESSSTPLMNESTKHDSKESNWNEIINGFAIANHEVNSESEQSSDFNEEEFVEVVSPNNAKQTQISAPSDLIFSESMQKLKEGSSPKDDSA